MSARPCCGSAGLPGCAVPVVECAVGFKMRAGAKLIVEARTRIEAQETFERVLRRDQVLDGKTAKLAANLFFAQAEPTGTYWIFPLRGKTNGVCHQRE